MKYLFLCLSLMIIIRGAIFAQDSSKTMPNDTKVVTHEKTPPVELSVRILAGPNPGTLTYTGCWVYVKNGKDISVDISDKTNRFKTCWGNYIKSCKIRRTSTNEAVGFANWFYFQIVEDETNIFESPELTNEDMFFYHK